MLYILKAAYQFSRLRLQLLLQKKDTNMAAIFKYVLDVVYPEEINIGRTSTDEPQAKHESKGKNGSVYYEPDYHYELVTIRLPWLTDQPAFPGLRDYPHRMR
ncbi:hypothetical protein T11_4644 [Trichinella zimbabwensis]|uniref:Uncharacterized protein n=1 Tax=Trichinella zimbabwensis TaxID=268475 RepID=A0A0V1HFF1_9BILA|nr:hypothetical protein T11_4644 [Trichinella zimbabwensis]